jgi:NTP pyrophosphatase (non-canonical NTP hydrolase)
MDKMNIEEFQQKAVETVKNRLKKKGLEPDIDLSIMHLTEELGELVSQRMNTKLKRRETDLKNIGEEIADCIIMLAMLAEQYNINISKVLPEKLEEINNKDLS